jgi:hypothetical protein
MAASPPEMFKASTVDEEEIVKLVEDHLLPLESFSNGGQPRVKTSPP